MRQVTRFYVRRRHLPHWEEPGGTYFVTWRLNAGAICDLCRPDVGAVIVSALLHFNGTRYRLHDYTVMPDHVHAILQPISVEGACEPLARILQGLKGWTGRQINALLDRRGPLWLHESYDHLIRNEQDYREKARYIWENPLRKGIIDDPADWPWCGNGQRATSHSSDAA